MIKLPEEIKEVINKLEKSGYEAYVVGGCIRDSLLNREINDYDLATNALPEKIEEIFKEYKTIDVGRDFGTIILIYKGQSIEITTYRVESEYIDGRRPKKVKYTDDIILDLSRRDFTINAMAYNPKTGILDYFNGVEDLKKSIIRTVNDPYERFEEDHLRILRCIRFSSQLSFKIEEKTYKACVDKAKLLDKISHERIREELFKILLSPKPSYGIELLRKTFILDIILPELVRTVDFNQHSQYHDKDLYRHSLCVLDRVEAKIELRLAALFHDLGKLDTFFIDENGEGRFFGHEKESAKIAEEILKKFNTPKKIRSKVKILIENHMGKSNQYSKKGLRRLIYRVGRENILDLIDLQKADMACTRKNRDISFLEEREAEIKSILEENNICKSNRLKIDGYDIMELGYKEGKKIGEILDYLTILVVEEPSINNREELISIVKNKFTK